MPSSYRTRDGDVLDRICFEHYGTEHGTTEIVLQANHGLCLSPVALPAGMMITLPDINIVAQTAQTINLWD